MPRINTLTAATAALLLLSSIPVATAQQTAANSAPEAAAKVHLPNGDTPSSFEHIFEGPNDNITPERCKQLGGLIEGIPSVRRCNVAIQTWLNQSPANVVAMFCVPKFGRAFAALMTAQQLTDPVGADGKRVHVVWTSAQGVAYGYAQAHLCQ